MGQSDQGEHIYSVVSRARNARVALWVANDNLHFRAAAGAMTQSLREELTENKAAIVCALSEPSFRKRATAVTVPILHFYKELWTKIVSGTLSVAFSNATHWAGRIHEPIDLENLQRAVDRLVARHPILGCKVEEVDAGPQFRFGHRIVIHLEEIPHTHAGSPEVLATQRVTELTWRPFDTREEPLFRLFVLKLAQADYIIGFVVHHFIADRTSVGVLRTELTAAVAETDAAHELPHADAPLQYADYVTGYNEWLNSPALHFRLAYWKDQLRAAPSSRLPEDHVLDPDESCTVKSYGFHIDLQTTTQLRGLAHHLNSTLFCVLLAAKAIALSHVLTSIDVVILTMHHGRDDRRLAGMVGSTQNQIPLRIQVPKDSTFAGVTAAVDAVSVAAFEHRVPYHYVRTMLPLIGTRETFAEINFADFAQPADVAVVAHAPARVDSVEILGGPQWRSSPQYYPAHQMSLSATPVGIQGFLDYLVLQYEQGTIVRFFDLFRTILQEAPRDPGRTVRELLP